MIEILEQIINHPLYLILFGGGGIVVVLLTLKDVKRKNERKSEINIDINISNGENKTIKKLDPDTSYDFKIDGISQIDMSMQYKQLDFSSDEYYEMFLKSIEEKKRGRDIVKYEEHNKK